LIIVITQSQASFHLKICTRVNDLIRRKLIQINQLGLSMIMPAELLLSTAEHLICSRLIFPAVLFEIIKHNVYVSKYDEYCSIATTALLIFNRIDYHCIIYKNTSTYSFSLMYS